MKISMKASVFGFIMVLVFSSNSTAETCFTRCAVFAEYACESSDYVGFCVGFWGCDAEIGAHTCNESPDSRPMGASCENNSQCATNNCEKNECVCKKNYDCPSGKCKKPLFKQNYCN